MSDYAEGFISLLAHSQVILLSEVHWHHLLLYIVKVFKVFDFSIPTLSEGVFQEDKDQTFVCIYKF
ncbi:hypothetical protein DRN44_06605 [Thermococci archaeon]|nr:MAG: hypothetical protein DRN44_06605 [Thermococci archaeon]